MMRYWEWRRTVTDACEELLLTREKAFDVERSVASQHVVESTKITKNGLRVLCLSFVYLRSISS
jgi:hypothetical protein